jgi:hypothetical protein
MTCARSVRSFLICICSVLFPCSGQPPRGYTCTGPLQGTKTDLIDPTGRIVNTWNSSLLPGVSA